MWSIRKPKPPDLKQRFSAEKRPGVCRAFDFGSALLTTLLSGLVLPALLLAALARLLAALLTTLVLLAALLLLVLIVLVWVVHRLFLLFDSVCDQQVVDVFRS